MSTTPKYPYPLVRRLVGVVAAVALALGIGAVGAAPASARTVWDRVASCESGGRWKINTGNGYYGGLQFASRTWRGYGGGKYASRANRASKAEQIAIGRRVLAGQGAGAWATCGRRAHLTKHNGKANRHATPSTNPGATRKHHAKPTVSWTKKAKAKNAHRAHTVRVRQGDTLARIAHRHGVAGGWRGLWQLNRKTLPNPNRLTVGQLLKTA